MKNFLTRHAWLLLLFHASWLGGILKADWYVSPSGNDGNPGSQDLPFATLTRARDAVIDALATNRHQYLTVWIRGGTYPLVEPVIFGPEVSPSSTGRVRFRAFQAEVPVLSGGKTIEGWEVLANGTWRIQLPSVQEGTWSFRELFVNDVRQPRARHPNSGWLRVGKAGPDRRTSFSFQPGDLAPVEDLDQVELIFLHDWSSTRVGVLGIDENENILRVTDPIGHRAAHYAIDHFEPHPRYALENSKTYLDQPGEWYLNQATGELLYRPRPGQHPKNTKTVAPIASALLVVRGDMKADRPVRNIEFEGLHFKHCAWQIPDHGYAGSQAAFHEQRGETSDGRRGFIPAAVTFEQTIGCVIRDGKLAHLGGSGLWIGPRCQDNQVIDTIIQDVAANGIMVGEGTQRGIGGRPWWQAAPDQIATSNLIAGCLVEKCGQQFFGSVGIWAGLTRRTLIQGNEIRHLPYTGVSLGWMWNPTPTPCRENQVVGNHIHHVMQVLSDGGGIYTLGRQPGSELRENRIHDVPLNLGRAESNGMFLDEGTTEIVVADNVIYRIDRSPLRFHRATTNLVTRNLLVVKPGVDSIRYNNTRAEDIAKVDNTIAVEAENPH